MFKWHSENEWNKIENPEEMRLPKQNTIQNKCTVPVVDTNSNNTNNSTYHIQWNNVNEEHKHESMSGTNSACELSYAHIYANAHMPTYCSAV